MGQLRPLLILNTFFFFSSVRYTLMLSSHLFLRHSGHRFPPNFSVICLSFPRNLHFPAHRSVLGFAVLAALDIPLFLISRDAHSILHNSRHILNTPFSKICRVYASVTARCCSSCLWRTTGKTKNSFYWDLHHFVSTWYVPSVWAQ